MKVNRAIDDEKNLKVITKEVGKGQFSLEHIKRMLGSVHDIKAILTALRTSAEFREAYIDGLDRYRIHCVQLLVDASRDKKDTHLDKGALKDLIKMLNKPDWLPEFVKPKEEKQEDVVQMINDFKESLKNV